MNLKIVSNSIIILIICNFVLQSISFILKLPLNNFSTIASIIISIVYLFLYSKSKTRIAFFIIIFISLLISSSFFDLSWDGQDYQQEAIIKLSEGWNPVYETQVPEKIYYNQWLNHYPKLPWIYSASIYKLTNNIDISKNINLLLMFCVFATTYCVICLYFKKLSKTTIVLTSLLVALNPVCIYQSQSFYVDGLVYSSIVILVNSILLVVKKQDFHNLLLLISSLIITTNIKFTGTFYSVCILFFCLILFWKKIKNIFIKILIITTVLFLITGINPYIKNTIKYGNPLYPVFGSKDYSTKLIMSNQDPLFLKNHNEIIKFIYNLTVKPNNNTLDNNPLNITKTTKNDLKLYQYADIRIGGFGPIFIMTIFISLIIYVLHFKKNWKIIILFLIPILATTFSNPECWWSRYVPQFYLLPFLSLLINKKKSLSFILMLILIINSSVVLYSYYSIQYKHTKQQKEQLASLSKEKTIYQVNFNQYRSNKLRLEKYSIKYTAVQTLNCKNPIKLIHSTAILCP